QLGQVTLFYRGLWLLNIFFNLLHFAIWFVCLWLLLQYQWPHALGLAIVFWVVMTFLPLRMVLDRTKQIAQERAGVTVTHITPQPAAKRPAWDVIPSAGCA